MESWLKREALQKSTEGGLSSVVCLSYVELGVSKAVWSVARDWAEGSF